jgi:hypothetical protein
LDWFLFFEWFVNCNIHQLAQICAAAEDVLDFKAQCLDAAHNFPIM